MKNIKGLFHLKPLHLTSTLSENSRINPNSYWGGKVERMALSLFRHARHTVPAYQRFLKEHGVDGERIKTIADFKTLPVMDKTSYLRKYEYRDLFPNRDLSLVTTISATSGSTGEPFYFPRGEAQDAQYEYIAELFLKNQFGIDKKSTLGIIGFGLGIWIGGMFTYKVFNKIAAKGYRLSLLPVGPNKELFLKSLKKFGSLYDQVLIMGYPPFIKDIIDEARDHGIDWKDYNIKILTATEAFSEDFRDYLTAHAHIENPLTDIINIYGTVEFGTMAHETAITTLIRKIAVKNTQVFHEIFDSIHRLPTLAQYQPAFYYFEDVAGELLCTGFGSSMPLIRYRFPDRGGVIPYDTMIAKLKSAGVDILKEAERAKIDSTISKLPFVYVYERTDSSTNLFGIAIYAEYIRDALQDKSITRYLTGKFTMTTETDRAQNQFLEVNIELQKHISPKKKLADAIQKMITESLIKRSTEFGYLYRGSTTRYQQRLKPHIVLWSYEHSLHFKPGAKQKWVKRQ